MTNSNRGGVRQPISEDLCVDIFLLRHAYNYTQGQIASELYVGQNTVCQILNGIRQRTMKIRFNRAVYDGWTPDERDVDFDRD